ncbi:DUF397 domain-containing protein [Streptomyces sp. NBC_01023]|uniref:DUF397 domain-containing protein n=1 Tax=Streptomyces sp. NBC_01023 TaxID=2903724 RepID=UPI0038691851|nr:DUF397 domain-containing protein [Streptomyces sp. NBC_01023]
MKHVADSSVLPVVWWKATGSQAQSDCVECGVVDHDEQIVAVRDSKNPHGPAMLLSYGALGGLIGALRSGALN